MYLSHAWVALPRPSPKGDSCQGCFTGGDSEVLRCPPPRGRSCPFACLCPSTLCLATVIPSTQQKISGVGGTFFLAPGANTLLYRTGVRPKNRPWIGDMRKVIIDDQKGESGAEKTFRKIIQTQKKAFPQLLNV